MQECMCACVQPCVPACVCVFLCVTCLCENVCLCMCQGLSCMGKEKLLAHFLRNFTIDLDEIQCFATAI